MTTESITLRLPTEDMNAIVSLAESRGQTKTSIARAAIKQYCQQEAWYDKEIQKGIDDIEAGRVRPIEEIEQYWIQEASKEL